MSRSPLALTLAIPGMFLFAPRIDAQIPTPTPDYTNHGEDTNADGYYDHIYEDMDGDGNWDICWIDIDGDGIPEQRWIDSDDNGVWDVHQLNEDEDDKWDSGDNDTDEDGVVNWRWQDLDDDGLFDYDEVIRYMLQVPFPTGPTPQNPPSPPGSSSVPSSPLGLGGYLTEEVYALTATAPSLAAGYHSDLGPCGQLVGWVQNAGIASAALVVDGVTETLVGLPSPSFAHGVTPQHGVVGMYSGPTGFAPFFAPPGGSMIALPTLGGATGQAVAANDALTRIVGNSTAMAGFPPYQPTVWTVVDQALATPYALPVLSSLGGTARAVNHAGWIVGSVHEASGTLHAALWIGEPGNAELIDLGPGHAEDINDHGVVVGSLVISDGTTRAFRYEAGAIAVLRSPLGLGTDTHRATSINERGEIVGTATLPGGDTVAVYWPHAEGFPIVLEDRVGDELALIYDLTNAGEINDAGQILAAGYQGTEPLTFLLTPIGADSPDVDLDGTPDACQAALEPFLRGDVNGDASVNLADSIATLAAVFGTGDAPLCEDATDANDDGSLDISDAVFGLAYLFGEGVAPSATGGCMYDTTEDALGCESSATCSATSMVEEAAALAASPCPNGTLLELEGHWECIGGTWHFVTDATYECSGGVVQVVRTDDFDSEDPCP